MIFFISELFTQVILQIFIAVFTGLGLWFKGSVFGWLTLGVVILAFTLNLYKYLLEKNKINDFHIEITLYLLFPTSYVEEITTTDDFIGFLGYKTGENSMEFIFQEFKSIGVALCEYSHDVKFFKIPSNKTRYAYMKIDKKLQLRKDSNGIDYIPENVKGASIKLLKKIDSINFSFSFTNPVLAGLEDKNLVRGDAFIRIFVNGKKTEFYLNKKTIGHNKSDFSDLLVNSNTKNPGFYITDSQVRMYLYFPENLYKLLYEKE